MPDLPSPDLHPPSELGSAHADAYQPDAQASSEYPSVCEGRRNGVPVVARIFENRTKIMIDSFCNGFATFFHWSAWIVGFFIAPLALGLVSTILKAVFVWFACLPPKTEPSKQDTV